MSPGASPGGYSDRLSPSPGGSDRGGPSKRGNGSGGSPGAPGGNPGGSGGPPGGSPGGDKGKKNEKKKGKKKKKSKHDPDDDPSSSSSSEDSGSDPDGNPPKEGSDDEDEDRGRKLRRIRKLLEAAKDKTKVKEADHVKISKLPRVDQLRSFKNLVRQEVVASSGRGDPAFHWILEVEEDGKTFDSFAKSGRDYESLDCKLATALTKTCDGTTLGRDITAKTEQEAKEKRNIKGRQMLWMIYEHFKTNQQACQLFSILDLSKVAFSGGDKNLDHFISSWDGVLTGMKVQPPEYEKEEMFVSQIRKSTSLAIDIAAYDRAAQGTPERSYKFLYDSVKNYLTRIRQENNRLEQSKSLSRLVAAPAADKKKKGKYDKKSNANSRDSSASSDGKDKRSIPCRFFKKGTCTKGKDCPFSHKKGGSPHPIAPASPRGSPKGSRKGSRSNSPGKKTFTEAELAQRRKTPCAHLKAGRCSFGDRCHYSHANVAAPASEGSSSEASVPKEKKKKKSKGTGAPAILRAMVVAAHMLTGSACPAVRNSSQDVLSLFGGHVVKFGKPEFVSIPYE